MPLRVFRSCLLLQCNAWTPCRGALPFIRAPATVISCRCSSAAGRASQIDADTWRVSQTLAQNHIALGPSNIHISAWSLTFRGQRQRGTIVRWPYNFQVMATRLEARGLFCATISHPSPRLCIDDRALTVPQLFALVSPRPWLGWKWFQRQLLSSAFISRGLR